MSPALPLSHDTVIGLTVERFKSLIRPPGHRPPRNEPSPMKDGGTPHDWALAAGLTGDRPHEAIRSEHPSPLDCGLHDPDTVAHTALQRLCARAEVDRISGVPMRYRPRMG